MSISASPKENIRAIVGYQYFKLRRSSASVEDLAVKCVPFCLLCMQAAAPDEQPFIWWHIVATNLAMQCYPAQL